MSEYCSGVGGGVGAAPMGGEVDGIKRERLRKGRRLRTMGSGGGVSPIRPRRAGMEIIKMTVVSCRSIVEWRWRWGWSGAEGEDGRWGCYGATARRASSPDDGRRRGRASDPDEVGGDGIIMVAAAPVSSASFCRGSTAGIIWREKKVFSRGEWEISR